MMKWINDGGIYFPTTGEITFLDTPGKGVFQVSPSPNPMDKRLGYVKYLISLNLTLRYMTWGVKKLEKELRGWKRYDSPTIP